MEDLVDKFPPAEPVFPEGEVQEHGSELKWKRKSKAYRELFEDLVKQPLDSLKLIGEARMCVSPRFIIGKGSYGTSVHIGLWKDGTEVAVKRILSHFLSHAAEEERQMLELPKLRDAKNVVNYRCFEKDDTFSYLVLDLCEMTLRDFVKENDLNYLERNGSLLIREILEGIQTLHSEPHCILHRDLKPSNILVDSGGHLRVTDFGFSRILEEGESSKSTSNPVGTRNWKAVETLAQQTSEASQKRISYHKKSDIQVVGMISCFILTKEHPFGANESECDENLRNANPVNLNKVSSRKARQLISRMLQNNIKDRPYAEEALQHPYVNKLMADPEHSAPIIEQDRMANIDRPRRRRIPHREPSISRSIPEQSVRPIYLQLLSWALKPVIAFLLVVLLYQWFVPGSTFKYWRCRGGSIPGGHLEFVFNPLSNPTEIYRVHAIQFSYDELSKRSILDKLVENELQGQGKVYYFLNLDRCAYNADSGRVGNQIGGYKSIGGGYVLSVNYDCSTVYYYGEEYGWKPYKTARKLICNLKPPV